MLIYLLIVHWAKLFWINSLLYKNKTRKGTLIILYLFWTPHMVKYLNRIDHARRNCIKAYTNLVTKSQRHAKSFFHWKQSVVVSRIYRVHVLLDHISGLFSQELAIFSLFLRNGLKQLCWICLVACWICFGGSITTWIFDSQKRWCIKKDTVLHVNNSVQVVFVARFIWGWYS